VLLVEHSISRELLESRPADAPSVIFIDIQPNQRDAFIEVVQSFEGARILQMEPVLRARVVRIAGVPVDEAEIASTCAGPCGGTAASPTGPRRRQSIFSPRGPGGHRLCGPPLVSVEDEVAHGYGGRVGDSLTFNVMGRMVEAEIANLRSDIDWSEGRVDFVFVLSPGVIDRRRTRWSPRSISIL
jgi:putative ABC transport system permease protein